MKSLYNVLIHPRKALWSIVPICLALWLSSVSTTTIVYADEQPLTRGSVAQLLVEIFDLEYTNEMTEPFEDVEETSPYYEAICVVYHKGLMNGIGSSKFSPNGYVTRAEVASLIYRCGLPSNCPDVIPTDVTDNLWYYNAVCSVC